MAEKQKLTSLIGFRVPPSTKEDLLRRAKSKGLSLSEFLFRMIQLGIENVKSEVPNKADEAEPEQRQPITEPPEKPPVPETFLVDDEFLRSLREEVKAKYPWLDFDVTLAKVDRWFQKHPAKERTRDFVRGFFRGIATRRGSN